MHELGMCEAIVEAAVRRAGDRKVRAMRVRVGGHPVDPEVIEQGVRMAALGTVAEGAGVDLVLEPLRVHCRRCRAETPVNSAVALAACPACGAVDVTSAGHENVVLESITVDAPAGEAADGVADRNVQHTPDRRR
ncbi:hydrogenase maturation nickel metallochaperone HypA [Actinomadura spongiicola]|uniref:Hydrogenase maturation factor HypA n=1 Tax=Actinomadura spongiicola TaxID=2303421 RepID=A0A372GPX0_9ACTN|nr:hydrogenase maturation nickel metallochaperone HypA [Actinomadura spongiicola]RFS87441.1 hydrogenase maturation nickel metallochaperone HypA [Actinomadura spongiicola]